MMDSNVYIVVLFIYLLCWFCFLCVFF